MQKEELLDLCKDFNILTNGNDVIVYHATSKEKATKIIESQMMFGKEDGLFFSNIPNGEIGGYGDSIIEIEIPFSKIILDDQFSNELHFRMPCAPNKYYKIKAKIYKH